VLPNATAALVLMVAAFVLWRMAQQAQRAESAMARQQHLASLGEMSAVLAHEIRNPVAAAKGHAQLLAEQIPEDAPHRRWVDMVVEHVIRLEELTTQLLEFARTAEVEREPTSPVAIIEAAAAELEPHRITIDAGNAPKTWNLDPSRMRQVATNLLQNALQASPPDALVEVSIDQERGSLRLQFRDHGEGIPPGEEERIFEPFHTKRVRGTGLGLAVVRRIVDLHGGAVDARQHPDGGAVFVVTLP
jgi:two-component system sensor histidine kinase HydH